MVAKESDSIVWSNQGQNFDLNLNIRFAKESDINKIEIIRDKINKSLLNQGFNQWDLGYPNKDVFLEDINLRTKFLLETDDNIVGFVAINKSKNPDFFRGNFQDQSDNFRVISRLGIDPDYQSQGFAKLLMDFAENRIIENKFSSIKLGALDTYKKVVNFYRRRNYNIVGQKYFPESGHTYNIMEKLLR